MALQERATVPSLEAPKVIYLCLDPGVSLAPGQGSSVHAVSMIEAMRGLGARVLPLSHAELIARRPAAGLRSGAGRALEALPRGRGHARVLARLVDERPRLAAAVEAVIAEERPDLVYERASLSSDLVAHAARAAGVNHVLEVNAPLAREGERFRHERLTAVTGRHERRGWRLARRVCVVSTDLARQVEAAGQTDVVLVPNAVDHARFHPGVEPDRALRKRLRGRYAVAFAGTLKPWHDLPTLVAGVAALRATVPAVLLLVGDGPGRAEVQRLADASGVPLETTGRVAHERVPSLLATAGACVAPLHPDPSLQYFSPLKAMEYLALGRPTVVAEAGDLADLTAAGAAFGYVPGSPASLATALGRVAGDPVAAGAAAERGLRLASAQSWERAARRSLDGLVALGP